MRKGFKNEKGLLMRVIAWTNRGAYLVAGAAVILAVSFERSLTGRTRGPTSPAVHEVYAAGKLPDPLVPYAGEATAAATAVNVTQHHNHDSRDGLYIDPAFTQAAAANLTRDPNFNGTIVGNVYAQPLYIEGGPGCRAMIVAVTESNNVYALDAANGSIIWQRNVGTPVPVANLPCGDINPLGITGTPIVDFASRSLFFDAMTTPDGGTTKKHLIFSLNVDTSAINSGWPVDVDATAVSGSTTFTSSVQNERGALAIVNNVVYVPYGGHFGDCGNYHGWLVGVPINNPASVTAWATPVTGGGAWAVSGVASDGATPFIATGNTFGATAWSGGEAIIRFQSGPVFSGVTNDYWAPNNWKTLDNGDIDLGGSGALLVDVPGATPSQLVVALGKDGNAYLVNRSNLGGVSNPVAQSHVSSNQIIQAAATYRTSSGTYVAFRDSNTNLTAFHINPTNPPTITSAWSVSQSGRGSPFVTSTDGANDVTVWVVGSEGDQRLHGYDGDTGKVVYAGGGANELMTGTRRFNTGIAARGRVYIANDNKVYAFTLSTPTPAPSPAATLLNISTRMRVLTGDQVLIGGFIITGNDPKKVIIRGMGPSLNGVGATLSDPTLELHQGSMTLATNDNWKINDQTGQSQEADIRATTIPPANDLESAILTTLTPGPYTAILAGKNGGTGVGLVEVYDLGQGANSQLANISTRGFVDTADNVMIGGLIVGGGTCSTPAKVIVRGLGPSVPVTGALGDPTLELHDVNGATIATNDNWKIDDQTGQSQEAAIRATTIPPPNDLESALIATLAPGNYTAIVRGKNNTTGVGLVEVYNLQ